MSFPILFIENLVVYTADSKPFKNKNNGDKTTAIPRHLIRRCSTASKIALEVANQALRQRQIDHAVFCSQHGELECAASLLKDIAHKNLLSPVHFSQSVHNTAAGLFSVMHNLHQDIVSLAAGENTFFMGVLEAFAWIQLNPRKTLLFVMFDAQIPVEYQALNVKNNDEYAMAFLVNDHGDKESSISLSVQMCDSQPSCIKKTFPALEFLEWFLYAPTKELTQNANHQTFKWQKKINA